MTAMDEVRARTSLWNSLTRLVNAGTRLLQALAKEIEEDD